MTTSWDKVKVGDRVRCPGDGATEQVLYNRGGYPVGRRAVRTDRHDHYPKATAKVAVVR